MRLDPHSYADLDQALTTDIELDLTIDFEDRCVHGSAILVFSEPATGTLDLDTRGLVIASVSGSDGVDIHHELSNESSILGSRLRLRIEHATSRVHIRYKTGRDALALMWLTPEQTDGGSQGFLLTQCQATHARSVLPVQDTPAARICYRATLRVPPFATAVMSAAPGACDTEPDGTRVFRFEMPQPIPPYLIAFAVGDLVSADLGPRCRVFAEPGVIDAASWEFSEVESMLTTAEGLFGPYEWERYDFIVLPASFPLGGMENPRMTFLTPTLIAGDRSLVGVLAHELAHSWTGNLVTNANNEHFWLNEGWTVWAERRILEELYGEEEAIQQAILGRTKLEQTLAERSRAGASTALCYDQEGLDPDREFSKLPYEKGFLLIATLEATAGRERFDAFVRRYIETFRFQSITSAQFVEFVRKELPSAASIDLDSWIMGTELPDDAPRFASARLQSLVPLALSGARFDGAGWSTTEKLVVLSQARPPCDANHLAAGLGIDETSNLELRSAWLELAIRSDVAGLEPRIERLLDTVGRTKLIQPIYRAMARRPDLKDLAQRCFSRNRSRLHSSTIGSIDAIDFATSLEAR